MENEKEKFMMILLLGIIVALEHSGVLVIIWNQCTPVGWLPCSMLLLVF